MNAKQFLGLCISKQSNPGAERRTVDFDKVGGQDVERRKERQDDNDREEKVKVNVNVLVGWFHFNCNIYQLSLFFIKYEM